MEMPTLAQLEKDARAAGYHVLASERLRANRCLLIADEGAGQHIAILVQSRRMIGESDVQDLAEIVRIRRLAVGILLVGNAVVSEHAERALLAITDQCLHVCATLPPSVAPATTPRGFPRLFGLLDRS